MHPNVHRGIFHDSQAMEATPAPINRWVYIEAVVHTLECNGILLSHKKEWNLTIYNSIEGPRGYYAQ